MQHSYRKSESTDIKVSADGDRHALEALYLEVCELAKQKGLKIEWRLTRNGSDDRADA
jgi:hypothetical protein